MSADNWTYCPRCKKNDIADRERKQAEVEDSYGKIPAAAYVIAVSRLEEESLKSLEETLREDYSIGVDDGVFSVDYRAYCTRCQYEFAYKYEVDVPEPPTKPATKKRRQ